MDGSTTLPPPPPLAQLLDRGPAALFLDFDGTLVEMMLQYPCIMDSGSADHVTNRAMRCIFR